MKPTSTFAPSVLVLLCLPFLAAPFTFFPAQQNPAPPPTRLYNAALIVSSDAILSKSVPNASPSATSADALVVYLGSGSEAEVSAASAAAMQCKPKRALVLHSSRVSPKAVLEALGPHCTDTSTTSLLGDPVGFFSAEAIECYASSPPLFQEDGSPSAGLTKHGKREGHGAKGRRRLHFLTPPSLSSLPVQT